MYFLFKGLYQISLFHKSWDTTLLKFSQLNEYHQKQKQVFIKHVDKYVGLH